MVLETGVFPFKFTYYNIGMYNDSGELGRLMDGEEVDTVVGALAESNSNLNCLDGVENGVVNGGYVCHYLTNCPECTFKCDDDNNCEFEECDDYPCILECPNCVFDGNNTNFAYRTVSLNNMFPNTRAYGENWDSERSQKAEDTLNEIKESGETIYTTPEYEYILTPLNMQKIREYNDEAGSYTNSVIPSSIPTGNGNDAVHCDRVTFNGKTYNVKCKSSFLDIIEDGGFQNKYAQSNSIVRNKNWTLYDENKCGKNCGPSWK